MATINRRHFVQSVAGMGAGYVIGLSQREARAADAGDGSKMRFGLVTYLWGKDMDLPTLLTNCEKSGLLGVELRTEHAHAVEPSLTPQQRKDVRRRFADSPVELVGYGSNAQYHENDPAKLKHNIELTKKYIQLMHDISLHPDYTVFLLRFCIEHAPAPISGGILIARV